MRVGVESQSEMTAVARRVDGLLHRAQQHRMDLLCVGAIARRCGNGLKFCRPGVVADAQTNTGSLEVVAQRFFLFGGGTLVHPKQTGVLAVQDEIGAADIGGEHRFFDQLMGFIAGARNNFFDASALVTDDLRFDCLEVDCPAAVARRQQRQIDLVQIEQVGNPIPVAQGLRSLGVGQYGSHLGVGEARVAAHHGRVELVGADLTVWLDHHVADHAQPLDIRVQRTQSVRKLFGQHRYDAARKVDAGGAIVGVNVDGRSIAHIVAHVGNGDQQPPSARGRLSTTTAHGFAIHRIVKIARVFSINRHQRHVAQVNAALLVLRSHLVGKASRLRNAGV